MAQTVNTTAFRLKKRLNWKFLMSAQKFAVLNNECQKLVKLKQLLFNRYHYWSNSYLINKNSKGYRIFSKLISDYEITNEISQQNLNLLSTQSNSIKKAKRDLPFFNIYQNSLLFEHGNFKQIKQNYKIATTNNPLLFISPEFLVSYAQQKMKEGKKSFFTNNNINSGLLKIIEVLFFYKNSNNKLEKATVNNISGLKIQCSGRWKRTKSGRAQRLNLTFGQLKKTSISTSVFYNSFSEKTKYGTCNIKIWIAFKV